MKPLIAEAIATKCAAFAEADNSVTVVDAALLGDSGTVDPWLHGLILVACPADTRARRLVESRGLSEAQAQQRIAAQVDPERKRRLARWVIENIGSVEALYLQADGVARELLRLARSSET
jgi:dephospho-CoA kinase